MHTLILRKPHTHAGTPYRAGDRLEVDDADLAWLVQREIGEIGESAQAQAADAGLDDRLSGDAHAAN